MKNINKKAQIQNLYSYVMIFILVGITLAIGIILLSGMKTAVMNPTATLNETRTNYTNLTNTPVASVDAVRDNNSNTLTTANYTVSGKTIYWTAAQLNSSFVLVDYTYLADTSSSDSFGSTIDALVPIATDWMPILIIVSVVGILLAIIIGAFSYYKGRQY